jgi:endonuclease III
MQIEKIYQILKEKLANYKIPLAEEINVKTKNPFFVLIATILSSRTKDQTTTTVCDKLFKKVKNFKDLEKIDVRKLESLLYPVGFYKTKTKNLKLLAKTIKEKEYIIPQTIEELILLPGVGRKTANLVLSVAFKKEAICVDTHVHRIMNRIGYINTNSPFETEMTLREKLPLNLWNDTNYLFVILGQNICFPRKPNCSFCPINKYCKKIGVKL